MGLVAGGFERVACDVTGELMSYNDDQLGQISSRLEQLLTPHHFGNFGPLACWTLPSNTKQATNAPARVVPCEYTVLSHQQD